MNNATTINKLHEMRLSTMAESFRQQLSDDKHNELSFEERIGLIVDMEWAKRKSNKLLRLKQVLRILNITLTGNWIKRKSCDCPAVLMYRRNGILSSWGPLAR